MGAGGCDAHLVRVTRRDMQAWMPEVRPAQPLALDPGPALAELLDAIRQGGREAYLRLLEVLRELKTLEAGTDLCRRALAELARAQGIVLGNVGVFVDASVDSETLTHSKAALATALVHQGWHRTRDPCCPQPAARPLAARLLRCCFGACNIRASG